MNESEKKQQYNAERLMSLHRELFPKTTIPSRSTTDGRGNFIMPSAYRPTKTTYVSQVK